MKSLATLEARVLQYDPIAPLLAAGHPAITLAVRNDLLGQQQDPESLWKLPVVLHAERSQNPDGSWKYHGGSEKLRTREDYAQLATFQQLLVLVSQYRLDRRHPMIRHAASFLFSHQTHHGDIRGIFGTQYTPYYTADMIRLLIEAGYHDDRRVIKGLEWLVGLRQDDGGWAIPLRTASSMTLVQALRLPRPLEPNRTKPSSHLITGIVLRALAAHPSFRHTPEARRAARFLASRFFTDDLYVDRRAASYWTKLSFPFRWTDVVSALDSIGLVGISPDEPGVAKGLEWLIENQQATGLWRSGYEKSPDPFLDHWVTFAVARVFMRFFGRRFSRHRPGIAPVYFDTGYTSDDSGPV